MGELTDFNLHLSERLNLLFSFLFFSSFFFFFSFALSCFFPSYPALASNTDDLLRLLPRSAPQKDHGNDTNRSAVFEALGGTVLKLLAFRVIFILVQITCSWLSGLNLVFLFLKDKVLHRRCWWGSSEVSGCGHDDHVGLYRVLHDSVWQYPQNWH